MTTTLMDYVVATAMDAPDIEVLHEETWSTQTAGGFKGAGEGGVIGSVPALANAIEDALQAFGARITRLPVRPERVIELITRGQSSVGV
jgi:carbon-monoxide dehydrogenase large subunit